MTPVWYRVRDLEAGRDFYKETLGFSETYFDEEGGWAKLERGGMEIALAEGEPEDGGVAHVDVDDVKAEAERLRRPESRSASSSSCTTSCASWTCSIQTGTGSSSRRCSLRRVWWNVARCRGALVVPRQGRRECAYL